MIVTDIIALDKKRDKIYNKRKNYEFDYRTFRS